MSDNWIALVPEDPCFIPDPEKQSIARIRLAGILPEAEQVEIVVSDSVQFFGCGANFEKVLCPSCGEEVPLAWWQERMDEDYEYGFKLDSYRTPCCKTVSTLRELTYDWPQTFGRFALDAMNPGIARLEEQHRRELEQILGTKLTVVYQHV